MSAFCRGGRCLVTTTLALLVFGQIASATDFAWEAVKPSEADPNVNSFDMPNVVIAGASAGAPLAVFLPGTGGRPQQHLPLLQVISAQGYRVIGLSYNDRPAVNLVCPILPDPKCSAAFRQIRSFGNGPGPHLNPPAESIVSRLVSLLRYLDQKRPHAGWALYLRGAQPAWGRILLSGFSQGAGMAAYIAKQQPVYRVVLFSSPWDFTGPHRQPAPWLLTPSATPPDRWWAERDLHETTTDLIARAYAALAVPREHILLFDSGLAPAFPRANPDHVATVTNLAYAPQWRLLFGQAIVGYGTICPNCTR